MFSLIRRLFLHYWEHRGQFARFFVTGGTGTLLDIASLYCIKEYAGLRPIWAVVLNQILAIIYVFTLNKYWTFKAGGVTHRQAVKFAILCGFNYVFALVWMYFGNEIFGLNYLFVRLANIALAAGWNFLIYKHWVYTFCDPVHKPVEPPLTN